MHHPRRRSNFRRCTHERAADCADCFAWGLSSECIQETKRGWRSIFIDVRVPRVVPVLYLQTTRAGVSCVVSPKEKERIARYSRSRKVVRLLPLWLLSAMANIVASTRHISIVGGRATHPVLSCSSKPRGARF